MFSMMTCNKGSNNELPNNSSFQIISVINENIDPRPSFPETMSSKTAFEYLRDKGIIVGINLGNTLDAVDTWTNPERPIAIETAWGSPKVNQAIFNGYKEQGFQIVRIPVTWIGHIGPAPDYKIEESWLQRVAEVAVYARNAGLMAIINMHHDDFYSPGFGGWLLLNKVEDDPSIIDQYEKMWKQIAEYFINFGDWLMFEGFNELHDGNWGINKQLYNILNDINQRFTNTVRSTGGNNIQRYLVYNGHWSSQANSENYFILPNDISVGKQIISFHYYPSFDFAARNPNWGTEQDKTEIDNFFDVFRSLFTNNNIPVIIGENGPYGYVNHPENFGYNTAYVPIARQNRLNYIDYFYSRARENGLIPFYFETGEPEPSSGNLFNRITGQPSSPENAEIIRHMINAINNPIPRDRIGRSTFVDYWHWHTYSDVTSIINSSQRYNVFTINGNVLDTVQYAFAGCIARPDSATLNKLRASTSVSFKVLGDGKTYNFNIATSDILDYNYYYITFQTKNGEETYVTINFNDLTQPSWGIQKPFNKSLIEHIQISTSTRGAFSLTISDLTMR